MDSKRLILSIAVPVIVLLVKSAVVPAVHKLWPTVFQKPTAVFDFARVVATAGWDFSSVGFGFYVSALLSADSLFVAIQGAQDPGGQNMVTVASLLIFGVMYVPAAFVRFSLLDSWSELEPIHRFAYGLFSFVLGILMIASFSKLAMRAPTHKGAVLTPHYAIAQCVDAKHQERLWNV